MRRRVKESTVCRVTVSVSRGASDTWREKSERSGKGKGKHRLRLLPPTMQSRLAMLGRTRRRRLTPPQTRLRLVHDRARRARQTSLLAMPHRQQGPQRRRSLHTVLSSNTPRRLLHQRLGRLHLSHRQLRTVLLKGRRRCKTAYPLHPTSSLSTTVNATGQQLPTTCVQPRARWAPRTRWPSRQTGCSKRFRNAGALMTVRSTSSPTKMVAQRCRQACLIRMGYSRQTHPHLARQNGSRSTPISSCRSITFPRGLVHHRPRHRPRTHRI